MNMQDSSAQNVDTSLKGLAASASFMTGFTGSPASGTAAQIEYLETVAGDERSAPLMREVVHALAQRWQGHASRLCPAPAVPGSAFHH